MTDHLLNFHMAALRGACHELLEIVPNGDDEDFKSQIALLKSIRKNIKDHKKTVAK